MDFLRRLLGQDTDSPEHTTNLPQDAAGPESDIPTGSAEVLVQDHAPQDPDIVFELVDSQAKLPLSQPSGLSVGYASDVGQLRDHNEDTLVAIHGIQLGHEATDPFGVFIIADGMGGHRAGEVASSLAARVVGHDVLQRVYLSYLLNESPSADMAPLTDILQDAVQKANNLVHDRVSGGGTTLTCALVLGRRAYIAHVGDSRAYLLTSFEIRQVTKDHSYVGRLMELGELSPDEAAVHPQRHVLYRAIGQGENLEIDTYHQPLPPGSRLLLCSDGLSGTVSEDEISRIVVSAATPQEACENLLQAANDAGGPDNVSALLIAAPPE